MDLGNPIDIVVHYLLNWNDDLSYLSGWDSHGEYNSVYDF